MATKLNEGTEVALPIRNIISMIVGAVVAASTRGADFAARSQTMAAPSATFDALLWPKDASGDGTAL